MFSGSIVALVTPMHHQDEIDYEALSKLIEWHIEQGTNGIVVAGTTGESAAIMQDEYEKLIRHVVEKVQGKVPVIAGSAASATEKTIQLTRTAQHCGADACLLMTPAYVKPTQEGLYLHYKRVAETVSIPQILYNVPKRTAVDLLPETIARLAEIPNIIGVKEATGDLERSQQILKLCNGKMDIYSGDDATAKDLMLLGAKGTISVTANVAPKLMSLMSAAAVSGDKTLAEQYDAKLTLLHHDLFLESNPIPVKWALQKMGKIQGNIRLPLTPLSAIHHEKVTIALKAAGVH